MAGEHDKLISHEVDEPPPPPRGKFLSCGLVHRYIRTPFRDAVGKKKKKKKKRKNFTRSEKHECR